MPEIKRRKKYEHIVRCTCECGVELRTSVIPASHFGSTVHLHGKRIQALLDQNCLTLTEIAARVGGVTRERVRQGVCSLINQERRDEEFFKSNHPLAVVLRKCKELGFSCEVRCNQAKSQGLRQLVINGKLCEVRSMKKRLASSYYNIHTPQVKRPFDFCIYYAPEKGFLILPKNRLPRSQNMFLLDPPVGYKNMVGTYSTQHDWIDYLDAWEQLKN